tara:strand:+ start:3864 stop:4655 length:792 start_codon:yes stop_codon:yes gene_type:complete
MEVQFIRNATIKITYGGKVWLIDPFFADPHTLPPFAGKSRNPLVPLPATIEEIMDGVDHILITHLHPDHFDKKAQSNIHRSTPFLVPPSDAGTIQKMGFDQVVQIEGEVDLERVRVTRVPAQHGEGKILSVMGKVSGYILECDEEPTIYITGDTVWCKPVRETLNKFLPSVIICNTGGNSFFPDSHPFGEHIELKRPHKVIMDCEQVYLLMAHAKEARLVAAHIGALDHETVSREELREFLNKKGVAPERFFIPMEGERIGFN